MNENRPLINDTPGQPAHPMTDDQYADYLRMQEEQSRIPPPAPDPMQEQIEELQAAVIELAAMQAGGV